MLSVIDAVKVDKDKTVLLFNTHSYISQLRVEGTLALFHSETSLERFRNPYFPPHPPLFLVNLTISRKSLKSPGFLSKIVGFRCLLSFSESLITRLSLVFPKCF